MISMDQIRAARGLLGWSQKHLAEAAHISLPALANLERGATLPRASTLDSIQKSLEEAGVEFIDAGVRRIQSFLKVTQFEGASSLSLLFDDFYDTLQNGGELLVSGIDERKFIRDGREPLMNFLQQINQRRDIKVRLLIPEGDKNLIGKPQTSIYRWVPKSEASILPSYIYGDKYALIIWGPPLRVIVTHNKDVAESHRRQFDANWARALKIPMSTPYSWPE